LTFQRLEAPVSDQLHPIFTKDDDIMIELRIEGLACKGCVSSVERAIAAADPAAKADIDLDSGRARIESSLPKDKLVAVVEAAGYDVPAA
jgi:copper chaperone